MTTYKFKKGDRVRVTVADDDLDLRVGDTGTIAEDGSCIPYVTVDGKPSRRSAYGASRDCFVIDEDNMELVNPFKPGDTVRSKRYPKYVHKVARLGDVRGNKYDTAVTYIDGAWDLVESIELVPPIVTNVQESHNGTDSSRKYIVVLQNKHGTLLPSTYPFQHPTREAADKEAMRLANATSVEPGSSFVVFETVAKAVPPVKTEATLVSL